MKIAVITGASSGMGRQAAVEIANEFTGIEEVWLLARRKQRLLELEDRFPTKVRCLPMDITNPEDRQRFRETLQDQNPDVKILINAAGFGKIGLIGQMEETSECGMIRLNCEALCAVTSLVLPYMSRNSRILNFASAAAFLPQPGFGIYAATKAFVLSYSRALAGELKRKQIYVTAVCPGPVDTEFFDIAETERNLPKYKRFFMADAKKVVRLALRDSMMGKSLSICGISMKAFCLLCKVVPHSALLSAMTAMERK